MIAAITSDISRVKIVVNSIAMLTGNFLVMHRFSLRFVPLDRREDLGNMLLK